MSRQQVQPDLSMVAMQSQQDWIISMQALSPLVQVTHTPLSVISHLLMPMARLQQHTTMPFIIMQQLHMDPLMAEHKWCIMLQAMGSSQTQVIFIPPAHFSILKVQRGTIIQFMGPGMPPLGTGEGIPCEPIPGRLIPIRSII